MKLINPTITVQNAEGAQWLCSVDHQDEKTGERILVSMLVSKDPELSPAELYELVLQQARERMGKLAKRNLLSGRKPQRGGAT